MSASIDFSVLLSVDEVSPALLQVILSTDDLSGLNTLIAGRAERLTKDYISGIAPSRHKTAERLGAAPTNIMSRAAQGVRSDADANAATVSITPGHLFARAFGEVTIRPGPGKKLLTIPAHANSYGKRAGEFSDLEFLLLGQKKKPALATRGADGDMIVYYWLVPVVRQKQDRTLLPSDDFYLEEAEAAAEDWILDS